jgi:hypothetical protein
MVTPAGTAKFIQKLCRCNGLAKQDKRALMNAEKCVNSAVLGWLLGGFIGPIKYRNACADRSRLDRRTLANPTGDYGSAKGAEGFQQAGATRMAEIFWYQNRGPTSSHHCCIVKYI